MPASIASAARQAWSAWSGSGEGAPQKAMTASPMNLSTVPPSASTACAGQLQELADDRDHPVAQALAQAGEAGEVGEQDGELAPLAAGLGAHAALRAASGPARSG